MIYHLHPADENWSKLRFLNARGVLDLSKDFRTPKPQANWPAVKAKFLDDHLPASDIPDFLCGAPIFTERAIEALRDILVPAGQLLPIECGKDQLFVFLVFAECRALDEERADIDWMSKEKRIARSIRRFEFRASELRSDAIFRLPQWSFQVFVTQTFVDRVNAAQLLGFRFKKIWVMKT